MKESRFIELLNLYVDQQLTAVEAAELESEIHRDATRRRTYQQYCRMQKACTLLFEQECKSAPESSTLGRAMMEADLKTVAFPQPRKVWAQRGLYASGLAAMAACIALVMVRQPQPAGSNNTVASTPQSTAVAAADAVVQSVIVPPAESLQRPASQYSLLVAARMDDSEAAQAQNALTDAAASSQFDWMKQVELPPLRRAEAEAWVFQTKSEAQPVRERLAAPRRPSQPLYENAAFQYQR